MFEFRVTGFESEYRNQANEAEEIPKGMSKIIECLYEIIGNM